LTGTCSSGSGGEMGELPKSRTDPFTAEVAWLIRGALRRCELTETCSSSSGGAMGEIE